MTLRKILLLGIGGSLIFGACSAENNPASKGSDTGSHSADTSQLPQPGESKTKFSKVIGWPEGKTPVAPAGFTVSKFVGGLTNPRWIYVAPNGDIFVAQATTEGKKASDIVSGRAGSQNLGESPNSILIFRDGNQDGKPEVAEVFLSGLHQPFGMLVIGDSFYVANTDGLWQYPYKEGQKKITAKGKKILELPAGGYNNHWTRNIIANADKSKIYVSVGSGSNVGENGMEHEVRRANILEINPDGSAERIFAAGLRNPVGMDWNPETKQLWTAVNERDELGDDLVPDYITSVKDGAFYGWPYAYFGPNEDPRMKGQKPELVKKTIAPDLAVGAHTASLGLAFYKAAAFPAKYKNGAFIGQHGSWNRSELSGYKVAFVPFQGGKPFGKLEDFLTGFIVEGGKSEVYGRPVGVAVLNDGSLLVADDAGNTLWRVSSDKK
ncbi:MAG: PQQ-dependent sugar dehydrogenase [Arcticibacter sp.]